MLYQRPNIMTSKQVENKVKEYEHFIENVLKRDLKEIESKLDKVVKKHNEWQELQDTISMMRRFKGRDVDMLVPLDCGVSVNAETEDDDRLLVDIGARCLLEMNYDEADKYAEIRKKILNKQIGHYRQLAVQVKVNIKITLLAINQLTTGD